MSLLQNGKKLAWLKCSVGRDHVEPRPLLPTQVAEYIHEMMVKLDDYSGKNTAKRLGISTTSVSDFLNLRKFPARYSDIWGWGSFDGGRIPWSMFRRAGSFLEDEIISKEDFGMLINGVLNEKIPTSMVEQILYLKKKNPKKIL